MNLPSGLGISFYSLVGFIRQYLRNQNEEVLSQKIEQLLVLMHNRDLKKLTKKGRNNINELAGIFESKFKSGTRQKIGRFALAIIPAIVLLIMYGYCTVPGRPVNSAIVASLVLLISRIVYSRITDNKNLHKNMMNLDEIKKLLKNVK